MALAGVWFHGHLNDEGSVAFIQSVTDHAMGLIAAAFAFVLIAAFKIVSKVCGTDYVKMTIALVSMFVAVTIPPETSSWVFIMLLIGGGLVYYAYDTAARRRGGVQTGQTAETEMWESQVSPATGITLLLLVLVITVVITVLPSEDLGFRILKIFWRIGLCVFGGGIVVVPMLLK